MIREYHNHKPQTTLWHREEEQLNRLETPGRQIKQSNQLSLPHQAKGGWGGGLKCILLVPNLRPRFCCC